MTEKLHSFYILHQCKYKENSLLLSIFTREFGKLSAIARTTKKDANQYQPLVELKGQISISKKTDGLSRVYNTEFVRSCYQKSYISLLSLQYINELLYLLLNYSHEEDVLFTKYDFVLKNLDDNNYRYLLRMFELELLESLGQGIYIDYDDLGQPIDSESNYLVSINSIKKVSHNTYGSILGGSLLRVHQGISTWSELDLKAISKVTRIYIDNVLAGKQLKSRKLLIDYLNLSSTRIQK